MNRIGFRAHDFGKFESASALAERISKVKDPAFIQLALNKVIPSARAWKDWDEEYISSIREELAAFNVSVAIIGCYINPIHPDPEKRRSEIERFKKSLRLAKAFGCPYVGTETGTTNPSGGYSVTTADPSNLDIFRSTLAELLEEAEKCDSYVCIEGVNHTHTISSPARMEKILDEFTTDRLKVIFDPINLLPFEGIAEDDGTPLEHPTPQAQRRFYSRCLDIFQDKLVAIHCKDYILDPVTGAKVWDRPALTGVFDWKGFSAELRSRSIDVPWLLENLQPETVVETTRTLEQF